MSTGGQICTLHQKRLSCTHDSHVNVLTHPANSSLRCCLGQHAGVDCSQRQLSQSARLLSQSEPALACCRLHPYLTYNVEQALARHTKTCLNMHYRSAWLQRCGNVQYHSSLRHLPFMQRKGGGRTTSPPSLLIRPLQIHSIRLQETGMTSVDRRSRCARTSHTGITRCSAPGHTDLVGHVAAGQMGERTACRRAERVRNEQALCAH
jgi:hypothetical protein